MRILLADDHAIFAEGLQRILEAGGQQVVGCAVDGLEALQLARQLHPDLILMDIRMPSCNGLEATLLIKTECPDIQIVILTASADQADLFEALKSGASGYLLKDLTSKDLLNYITGLTRGEAPLSRELATYLLREFVHQANDLAAQKSTVNKYPMELTAKKGEQPMSEAPRMMLTNRQLEILEMVSSGLSYKEVGARLHLSENTVKYHMGGIVRRLHQKNREQVIAYAISTGLVRRGDMTRRPLENPG